ncbi:MAG: LCP family protein [Anaeromusa sp.]|uniref:LCP family protein n=1 Tax=Anaeromusa sp. TaxID=1872520 RepID=UPI002B21602D|nr:LCP family protein [Anaeromusa sp.]MEA4834688.1 LCP family protein [Anaeromusa sp.]
MSYSEEPRLTRRKPKRRIRKLRVAMLLGAIFLLVGVVFAVWNGGTSLLDVVAKNRINILVLGVDERADDVGRSDTSFVVTLDTEAKKITVLSIPRDSRVKIAGHGWDKFNHAFAFGGLPLSKSTAENLLGVSIHYTVTIDFKGFMRMIDALGGITIDVEKRMRYSDPYDDDGGLVIDLYPGVQRLSGKEAIKYVRYRDEEGDIGRVARQQKFLKALLKELASPQTVVRLPELAKEFYGAVKTDMPLSKILKLLPAVQEAASSGLATATVPGAPLWIKEVSYWQPNITELRLKVAQIQGFTNDESYMKKSEQLAREYKQAIPADAKAEYTPTVETKAPVAEKTPPAATKTPAADAAAKKTKEPAADTKTPIEKPKSTTGASTTTTNTNSNTSGGKNP